VDQTWEAACAAALAGLPGMGPTTLFAALTEQSPSEAWSRVCDGSLPRPAARESPGGGGAGGPSAGRYGQLDLGDLGRAAGQAGRGRRPPWDVLARRVDLARLRHHMAAVDIGATWPGRPDYPSRLSRDPQPVGALFWRGRIESLDQPAVAVVGTRRCSPEGRRAAFELGRDLAAAGILVVSGLALGIDGCAHQGALASEGEASAVGVTVGVAASGVDVPYPRRHAELWERVVGAGAVISETPPGHAAQAWRFPARNRVIAALARMVVVVESFEAGGSMLTVDAALARGIDVGAVPGPVHSPASAGSNRLLVEGAAPVRHAGDVLDALGMTAPFQVNRRQGAPTAGPSPPLSDTETAVLDAVGWAPTPLGFVVERTALGIGVVGMALAQLQERGLVEGSGNWWCRRSAPLGPTGTAGTKGT
jgi:DNA processing protein